MKVIVEVSDREALEAVYEALAVAAKYADSCLNATQLAIIRDVAENRPLAMQASVLLDAEAERVVAASTDVSKRLQLIKTLRDRTGCGLKEGKEAIERALAAQGK